MKKGSLVCLKEESDSYNPYVVIRGPYEGQVVIKSSGATLTRLTRCVDVLSPTGDIIKGVDCNLLERA